MVEGELLDLICNLNGVRQSLRAVGKEFCHLLGGLEILLTRVAHTLLVIEQLACIQTDKVVVRLRIISIGEVDIVGANNLDTQLFRQCHKALICLNLLRVCTLIPARQGLEELHLKVVVVAK